VTRIDTPQECNRDDGRSQAGRRNGSDGMVIIQHIFISWDKSDRSGKGAAVRRSVKDAYPVRLPPGELKEAKVILQTLRFGIGSPSKDPVTILKEVEPPVELGCVTLDWDADTVTAEFRYRRDCGGAPVRWWAAKRMVLSDGEWGQFVYNGRFGDNYESYWSYQKHVVNVGLFQAPTPAVFRDSSPSLRFESLAQLW
jgi:hypothetical protein